MHVHGPAAWGGGVRPFSGATEQSSLDPSERRAPKEGQPTNHPATEAGRFYVYNLTITF